MIRQITPSEAKARVHSGGEIALIDLREAGSFSEGHPLFAIPCPFSLFEAQVGNLVPNRLVPVLLMDDGDGLAKVAAEALVSMGHSDISVIEGGAPGWAAVGYTLFRGVNVPSKVLGELVEHLWRPKTLDSNTLKARQEEGWQFDFFDCRTPEEFGKMTVPGARCLPNGEVAHRLGMLDPERPLVLTCAGRTRGIIGVAGLSMFAPDREIYALENGTQGWRLAGFDLVLGKTPAEYPALDDAARDKARRWADELMAAEGIPKLAAKAVRDFLTNEDRTTFLLDVRSEAETDADPLPAFSKAPSGQLVQATDQWIGVRRARVVLADDLGLRAALAAYWLRKLGYEPYVAPIEDDLRTIPARKFPAPTFGPVVEIQPDAALSASKEERVYFIDARPSSAYSAEHVAGAKWVNRSRLSRLPGSKRYLVIGDGGLGARLVAREMKRLGHFSVALVEGGHQALVRAGATLEFVPPMPLLEAIDVTSFAHGRHDGDLNASRLYLDWEKGLVGQLDEDERAEFSI